MADLPRNVVIYGFAFGNILSDIRMIDVHKGLTARGAFLEDVIFSTWDDDTSNCVWLIAADRYLEEWEIENSMMFITENNIEEEYCLTNFI